MTHDVFISYSHVDRAAAGTVCKALEAASVRVWMAPRDMLPGAKWAASIPSAIEGAKALVLVFSRNVNSSEYISRELVCAVDRKMPIITFRIENVEPLGEVKFLIQSSHWLDAFPSPLTPYLATLVKTTQLLLGDRRAGDRPRKPAPEPPPASTRVAPPSQDIAQETPLWRNSRAVGAGLIAFIALAGGTYSLLSASDVDTPKSAGPPAVPIPSANATKTAAAVWSGFGFSCSPDAPWKTSQIAGVGEINGFARVVTMNSLEVGKSQVVQLSNVEVESGPPAVEQRRKLQQWLDMTREAVRCRPVLHSQKYCCDVGPNHLDVSAQILRQGWALSTSDLSAARTQ